MNLKYGIQFYVIKDDDQKENILYLGGLLAFAALLAIEFQSVEGLMMEDRRAAIRNQVEAAHSIVVALAGQAEAGTITQDEAKRRARDALRAIRFNGKDYVLVYGTAPGHVGRNLVHPDPKIEGMKSRSDEEMKRTFVGQMIERGMAEGGFTDYRWPRLGGAEPALKVG